MRRHLSIFLLLVFVFAVGGAGSANAKILTSDGGSVVVAESEIVNDDLFIGAQTAQIEGTVNGDVFVGAQTLKVSGVINGNLHAGGNTLILDGTVKGNVYAGGQNILVSGAVIGGSLLAGGATVSVDKDTTIGGSLLAGAASLSVDSQVKRSVYAGTGNFTLGNTAVIGKDLYYAAGADPSQTNISSEAKIAGTTYKHEVKTPQNKIDGGAIKRKIPAIFGAFKLVGTLVSFAGSLVVGFLYLKLFGKHLNQTAKLIIESFWKSLGVGFLVTISFVPGLIILLITVVGIPVAALATLILLLYACLAKIVVGMAAGNWLVARFKWKMTPYGTLVLGLSAFYLLKLVPPVGFLAGLIVLWIGLGALTLQMFIKKDA